MTSDPGLQRLVRGRFGEGVIARAEHGHEDLRLGNAPCVPVMKGYRVSRVIHEQRRPGLVRLPQTQTQCFYERVVVLPELRILIAVRMRFFVLLPQKLKRHSFFLHLPVNIRVIRQWFAGLARWLPTHETFQRLIAHDCDFDPVQPRLVSDPEIFLRREMTDLQTPTDISRTNPAGKTQP